MPMNILLLFMNELGGICRKSISHLMVQTCYKALIQDTLNIARVAKADGKFLAYDTLYYEEPEYLKSIAKDFVFYRQIIQFALR